MKEGVYISMDGNLVILTNERGFRAGWRTIVADYSTCVVWFETLETLLSTWEYLGEL